MTEDTPDKKRPERKKPRKATPRSLENGALYYLERFATSAENLRRVLMRRVEKSVRAHDTDRGEGAQAVDDIVARFIRSGLLDDGAYARARVTTFRRQGNAARSIRVKLRAKGVAADIIDQALATHAAEADGEDAERAAAWRLAKRRKLGPFNTKGDREDRHEKDLAALARAGFSYDVARSVVDADSPDDFSVDD